MNIEKRESIEFPEYSGLRCLMMPYIQGDFSSVPEEYLPYKEIIENSYFKKGDIGFLTIDESFVAKGSPHRGARAKFGRALHTEAGRRDSLFCWGSEPTWKWGSSVFKWGGGNWGDSFNVTLDRNVRVLLANNIDESCALWNAEHENTSDDGDIGNFADQYPYEDAIMMKAGEVYEIGILHPHESLPVKDDFNRQFLRIISSGVYGREPYFTINPMMSNV